MSDVVIKVENISKQYRLGTVGTGSLAHDLNRTWHRVRGKEDPYLKIGETNDRAVKGSTDYVWALRDINFQVRQGEVLGIIGRNGAGKSTLLKILSRTTTPTTGQIKIKGRVASLLEVGTGFHPELSGRENIFLNGAILGMTKKEIKSKFDEIVDFAGVERYIDTPVKRYSSGMYVRLAFGVAAHLEPEILIVDEVLAVGDAEFQKKALGKMKDVSGKDGRTVLFVSHNMAAIHNLCTFGILLTNGRISANGSIETIVEKYSIDATSTNTRRVFSKNDVVAGNNAIRILSINLVPENSAIKIDVSTSFYIELEFENLNTKDKLNCNFRLETLKSEHVFTVVTKPTQLSAGLHTAKCLVPGNFLNDSVYSISFMYVSNSANVLFKYDQLLSFSVEDRRLEGQNWFGKWPGIIRPNLKFTID